MNLHDGIKVLTKNWLPLSISIITGCVIGLVAATIVTPMYEASTQLYVSVNSSSQASGELVQGSNFARQSVQSYVSIVETEKVLNPVLKELELDLTEQELKQKVFTNSPINTSLLQITVTDESPELAEKLANAIGQSFKNFVQSELEIPEPGQISPVKITTVESATIPTSSYFPNKILFAAIGCILGVFVGIGITVFRTVLDTKIHNTEDIAEITDYPVIGGIFNDPDSVNNPLIVHTAPNNFRAEAFRSLRTNLNFLSATDESKTYGKSFVFTSAGPGEGKTTTIVNLALAIAKSGSRVLLIDGDLRKPKVANYMNIEGSAGLTDLLVGRAEIIEVLQRWGTDNLYVLPSGKIPPNPSELLGSKRMKTLVDELHKHFDFILVDAPPILLVTDAAVLSSLFDGCIVIAATNSTRKQSLSTAIDLLKSSGSRVMGITLTFIPVKKNSVYGYTYEE